MKYQTLSNQNSGKKSLVLNLILCLSVIALSIAYLVIKREFKSNESIMTIIAGGCCVVAILLMLVIHNKVRSPILRLILSLLGIGLLVVGVLLIVDLSDNEDMIKYIGYVNGGFSVVVGLLLVINNILILKNL